MACKIIFFVKRAYDLKIHKKGRGLAFLHEAININWQVLLGIFIGGP